MNHSRKAAVVLAVDHFEDDGIANLEFAEEDGREWMGFLKHRLIFDEVHGLFGRSLRKDDAMDLIEDRARALSVAGGGTFWVVYAGHAVLRDKGQQLLLCPRVRRNLLLGGIEDHTIPTEQIRLQTAFPGVDRVIVPDACRSPLETGTRDVGELETSMRGLRDFGALKGGVVEGGWGVLCACSDREKAQELKRLRRGLFSHTAMQLWEEDLRAGREVRLTHAFVDRVNAAMARVVDAENLSHRQHAWMQLNFEPPLLRTGRVESVGGRDPEGIEVAPRPSLAERVAARREAQRKAFEADWREYVAERPRLGAVALREHWIELCQSHGVEPGSAPGDLEWTAEGVRRLGGSLQVLPRRTQASRENPWENSLGMRFVPVKTSVDGKTSVLFSVWQTRVQDYAEYAKETSGVDGSWKDPVFKGVKVTPDPRCPVVNVSWDDAKAFCQWLTKRDRAKGLIPAQAEYRLPTDAEWSWAVGIGEAEEKAGAGRSPGEKNMKIAAGTHPYAYPWGKDWPPRKGAGNYTDESAKKAGVDFLGSIKGYDDGFATTSPVGSFTASPSGLFDLGGNVWEWMEDFGDGQSGALALRGGSWSSNVRDNLLSSGRYYGVSAAFRTVDFGFRLVLDGVPVR